MEVLWNQINLQRPPYRSWDVPVKEFDSRKFTETIEKILNDFKTFEVLHTEAALLSRLIYRMKSKFRSDKGLKHMEKVNRALLNYLNMSLEREYELLKEYTEITDGIVSLPPKQTLEYVLVRTQGFAKLMCRVELTAMTAGTFLKSRLHIGQSWSTAVIAYAVISRIWILTRNIIKKACTWYDNIYNYTETFKTVGIPWLPDNYTLPKNLSKWLDVSWFNEEIEKLPVKKDWEKSIFNLIKVNKRDEEDLIIQDLIIETKQNKSICRQGEDDVGSEVCRVEFEKASQKSIEVSAKNNKTKKNRKSKKLEKKSKLVKIKSEKDLVRLLKQESYPGLDKLQWQLLRKRIKRLLIKLTKNNTCDICDKDIKKVAQCILKWTNSE